MKETDNPKTTELYEVKTESEYSLKSWNLQTLAN